MTKASIYKNKSLKDLKGEVWKVIPYTEGYYLVSNLGRVKALARQVYCVANGTHCYRWLKERILQQGVQRVYNHYKGDFVIELVVRYCFEKTNFCSMVRRLVYEAFNAPAKKETMEQKVVIPRDGDGFNCKAENLELINRSELRRRGFKNKRYINKLHLLPLKKRIAIRKKAAKSTRVKINKYSLDGVLIATYPSLTSAARKNRVSIGCVGLCAQKKLKVLKGHIFRYASEGYNGELKDWNGKAIKVVQYSIAGKKLQTFTSIKEAARTCSIHPNGIGWSANKKAKHAGGYVWRFEEDTYKGEYNEALRKRKIVQLTLSGRKLNIFDSAPQAAKATGADYSGIRRVLTGKRKASSGFLWKWML